MWAEHGVENCSRSAGLVGLEPIGIFPIVLVAHVPQLIEVHFAETARAWGEPERNALLHDELLLISSSRIKPGTPCLSPDVLVT